MPICPASHPIAVSTPGYTNYCHNTPAFEGQDLQMLPASGENGQYRGPVPVMPEGNGRELDREVIFTGGQYQTAMRLISTNTVWLNGASGKAGNLVLGNRLLDDLNLRNEAFARLNTYNTNHTLPASCSSSAVPCEALTGPQINALQSMLRPIHLDLTGTAEKTWVDKLIAAGSGILGGLGVYFGAAGGVGLFHAMTPAYQGQPITEQAFHVAGRELVYNLRLIAHFPATISNAFSFLRNEWNQQPIRVQDAAQAVSGTAVAAQAVKQAMPTIARTLPRAGLWGLAATAAIGIGLAVYYRHEIADWWRRQ